MKKSKSTLTFEECLSLLSFAKDNQRIQVAPIDGCFYQWQINDQKFEFLADLICQKMGGEYNLQNKIWQTPFNPFEILRSNSPVRFHFHSTFYAQINDLKPFQVTQWLIDTFLIKNRYFPFEPNPLDILIPVGGVGGVPYAVLSRFQFSKFPNLKLDILEPTANQSAILRSNGFRRVIPQSFLKFKSRKKYDLIIHIPSEKPFNDPLNLYQFNELQMLFKAFSRLKMNGKLIGIIPLRYFANQNSVLQKFQNLLAIHGQMSYLPQQYGKNYVAFEIHKTQMKFQSRSEFNAYLIDLISFGLISQYHQTDSLRLDSREEILRAIRVISEISLLSGHPIFYPEAYLTKNNLINGIIASMLIEIELGYQNNKNLD